MGDLANVGSEFESGLNQNQQLALGWVDRSRARWTGHLNSATSENTYNLAEDILTWLEGASNVIITGDDALAVALNFESAAALTSHFAAAEEFALLAE